MKQGQWQTLLELYRAASELPPGEARAFLESAGCNSEMAGEVLSLLEDLGGTPAESGAAFEPAPGAQIGRYQIVRELGRGGMGRVYEARDTELGRTVALKFLMADPFEGRSAERLMREAQAASALNHPHIVTVHEVIRSGTAVAIVMEKVDGVALRTRMQEPVTLAQAVQFGGQIATAIAAAHAQGLMHRDLKPENIMVRPDGYIKVLDFGLARAVPPSGAASNTTSGGLPRGTWRYMSPEHIRGESLTTAADVFSMGLVLYEACTGVHPFAADSPLATAHAIATGAPRMASSVKAAVPGELDTLIGAMLHPRPEARPSALEAAERLAGLDLSARVRIQWGRWAAAAAVAIAVAAVVSIYGRGTTTPPAAGALAPVPFAVDPGLEFDAEISRDGTQAAYACSGPKSLDICLQPLAGGPVRRIGQNEADELSPTWSPDGRQVAFVRPTRTERGVIVVAPAEGGPERALAEIGSPTGYFLGRTLRWSADSRWLIVTANLNPQECFGLFAVSSETGQMRQLTRPPAIGRPFGDGSAAVSPDGKWLAFSRVVAVGTSDLYVQALTEGMSASGEPRKVETGKPWNTAPVWMPGGREIVFAAGRPADAHVARLSPFRQEQATIVVTEKSTYPAVWRGTLLYTRTFEVANLWQVPIRADGANAVPTKITASTSMNQQPNYSPDGKRVVFVSDRTGFDEVWTIGSDGAGLVQWTDQKCEKVAIPRWSPDGRLVTFSAVCGGRGDIYVLEAPGAAPRRVSDSPALDENSRWFPDGKWIYFTSFRNGVERTWKAPTSGGENVPIGTRMTSNPYVSQDGKELYFTRLTDGSLAFWKMASDGEGPEEKVLSRIGDYRLGAKGVYYMWGVPGSQEPEAGALYYYHFGKRTVSRLNRLSRHKYIFDVSPDESMLVYSQAGFSACDLMKVEGFR